MVLSKDISEKIINEINKVIDYDINIMDEHGLIIASTNPKRLNTYHEGAHQILRDHLRELIVHYDGEYEGCLKGINLPIELFGKIVGVIGITGEVAEVMSYGRIIKKMTEIWVENLFEKEQQKIHHHSKMLFIEEWITGNFNDNDLFFERNASQYNIDLHSNFTIAIIKMKAKNKWIDFKVLESINDLISVRMDKNNLFLVSRSNTSIVLSQKIDSPHLFSILSRLSQEISEGFPVMSFCGIGHTYTNYSDVAKSYQEAQKVIDLYDNIAPGVYLYDESVVPLIIDEAPKAYKLQFMEKIFSGCTVKEKEEFADFIIVYYNCNGSINNIANSQYIHKNTVQYKINKIIRKTGLDLRINKDLIALYFAANFMKSINKEK